ncbi:UDP-glucose 4-epimerase [Clostridiaceae bacterium JG1575]|nr:UDP-glucose 4-epimerase [Clostridiaceae bacterium JG1575]
MSILVCGGAGYIGSHFVRMLCDQGDDVVVADALFTGHREAVDPRATFYPINIADEVALRELFEAHDLQAVVHFAAYSQVGESMKKPLDYFENNVAATLTLLQVMRDFQIPHLVFSSTAAVYGDPGNEDLTEKTPPRPMNPYGESKLAMERMIHWMAEATGMTYMSMRYFNVAGAWPDGTLGEDHRPETHIIPIAVNASLKSRPFTIFGSDYPTPDGTCVRDYVHVMDLVAAHLLALSALQKGAASSIYNLGSGSGYSNGAIVRAVEEVTGVPFPVTYGPRRPGDPARLVAVSQKIRQELGWTPQYESLRAIIESAVRWHRAHPEGYSD